MEFVGGKLVIKFSRDAAAETLTTNFPEEEIRGEEEFL